MTNTRSRLILYGLAVITLIHITSCGDEAPKNSAKPMSDPPKEEAFKETPAGDSSQSVSSLTAEDEERLASQRAVVEQYLGDNPQNHKNYQTAAGKLGTIRAVLNAGVFKPDDTYELQCLGVVLGDAFVQELDMEWVIVEDEHGRDSAVRLPETTIILYPLTMISKRVERGEEVDVFDLFNSVAAKVQEIQDGFREDQAK